MSIFVDGEFEIVWLDQQRTADLTKPDLLNRQVDLDQFFTCLHVVNSVEACLNHLSSLDLAEKVLLIVSGSLGESILPSIHERSQIISVFIFCCDIIQHREWAHKYTKIRGIYDKAHDLVEAIQHDAKLLVHHFIPSNIFTMQDVHQTSFQNMDKEQANFLWFQLLIDVLVRLPRNEEAKQELLDESRRCYIKNATEITRINEFENTYTSDQAVQWYTRDSFLYRLINRAFRTRNIDTMFKFRFFVIDLLQQLERLHQMQRCSSSSRVVYRSQVISSDEFNKIKQNAGGIYCVNTFLSTSTRCDVAVAFNRDNFARPYFERVLFEIEINDQAEKKWKVPFADIMNFSSKQCEGEVLLSIGSMFRIDEIDIWCGDLWLVRLALLEQSGLDESLREYYLAKDIGEQSTLLVLSRFLGRMDENNRAKRFCELLLKEESLSDNVKVQAYINLAYYQYRLEDYDGAECSCNSSLELQRSIDCCDPSTFNILGLIYSARNDLHRALYFHEKAVDSVGRTKLEENEFVAAMFNNLGMAWIDLGQVAPALYWCEQVVLSCRLKFLPPNHPDLLTTYANISHIYLTVGEFSKARTYCQKALDIQEQILPPFHMDKVETLNNLSLVCGGIGEYRSALNYLHQAQRIILHYNNHNHVDLVPTYLGLAAIYEHLEKDTRALNYYKLALRGLSLKNVEHRYQLATTWNNMGFLYLQNKRYKNAMIEFRKALSLERRFLPIRHQLVLTTLSNIGMVYQRVGLFRRALYYHRFVLKKRKHYLRPRDVRLATTWDNIGFVLHKIGQCKRAMRCYKRALTINVLSLPPDHLATQCICEHIGDAYGSMGKKHLRRHYYQQPERMACQYLCKIKKRGVIGTESDDDIIVRKKPKSAMLFNENACVHSSTNESSSKDDIGESN